jgi:hypothetical protein
VTPGDFLQRIKSLFFTTRPISANRQQATIARRHEVMHSLQREVRQLQQEITDLAEREGIDPDPPVDEVESPEMQSLHRRLSAKQAELAKYQARI